MNVRGSTAAETEADDERSPNANQRMRLPITEQVLEKISELMYQIYWKEDQAI